MAEAKKPDPGARGASERTWVPGSPPPEGGSPLSPLPPQDAPPHSPLPDASPFAQTVRGPAARPPKDDLLTALGWDDPLSLAHQDLSTDKLIRDAPRMQAGPYTLPTLGGIPLMAKIGQGGMGAVYYGLHLRLRREVAVKVLPFHLVLQQPDLVKRFFREAQMAARVQSPHLVSVLDVNEDQGLHYLVMEYVHGMTGGVYLKFCQQQESRRGLPESEVLEIGCAVCEGLAAAHSQGVVHRDIKVDNILLPWTVPGQRVNLRGTKLADLGLGRSEEHGQTLTGTQATLGTPGYMAPEQASDARRAGPPADVFSLGATLYALLTGHAPFVGSSAFEVLLATAQKPHAPLGERRQDVSAQTAAAIDRCLQKAPEHRYRDAMELLTVLRNCMRVSSTGIDPATTPTVVPQRSPLTPTPAPAPQTPPVVPLTPAGASPSAAPTPVAPVAATTDSVSPTGASGRGRIGLWFAALVLIGLVVSAGGGWYYSKTQFDTRLSLAREALQQRDWARAKSECEQALRFSFMQDENEPKGLLDRALAGSRFAEEMAAAKKNAGSGEWKAAEDAYSRALGVAGFSDDRDAAKGLAEAQRQLSFQNLMAQAHARSAAREWDEAKRLFEEALRVSGFENSPDAITGRCKAEQALAFGEAMAQARSAVVVGNWQDALTALGKARSVPGYENEPSAAMFQARARNGLAFEKTMTHARQLLEKRHFSRSAAMYGEASNFACAPDSPISGEAMITAQNGKTYALLLAAAQELIREERFAEAQMNIRTSATLPGFDGHSVAGALAAEAGRGLAFLQHLADGQQHLKERAWPEALAAFEAARTVEGFSDDRRAHDGVEEAQRGVNFTEALQEARRESSNGEWARAQAAYRRALDVEGFDDNPEAQAGLKRAAEELKRLGKERNYQKALAEAQRLRKAVPPGPRQRDAWAAVRSAADAAIKTGHTDVSAAQALNQEAIRAEQAAKGWLDSDRKLIEARAQVKQGNWDAADAALQQALKLAARTDTAELQAAIAQGQARAQGKPHWDGDRKYFEYKGRRWLIGIRGKPMKKDPFVGSVRLKPGTGPTVLWVRVAEKRFWFIRDETNDVGVGFQVIRNENKKDPSKTERTEWVGPYAFKDGKWTIEIKMFRQYDKQNGGSGSLYPKSSKSELSVQEDGNVFYKPRVFSAHPMERVSYDVSQEMARRVIDAYLEKWFETEKNGG